MKKITFVTDEKLIGRARLAAKLQHTTLDAAFRKWLEEFARPAGSADEFDSLMKRLRHINSGRSFTRDEMNER